ncbi:MAG: hypothetical protein ACR2QJ_04790 [Geminicoccaceae bacterium]
MSKEQRKQLFSAYVELELIDYVLEACNEAAPDYASSNQAIMAAFTARRSIDNARSLVEEFGSWAKSKHALLDKSMSLLIDQAQKKLSEDIADDPDSCKAAFERELDEEEFPNLAAVVQAFGLETTGAAVAKTTPPDPAVDQPAADPVQPAAATPIQAVGMPTPIGDRVEELPGISWQALDGVHNANTGGAFCVWRCVALEYGEWNHPLLIIHEAVPLGAEEAIDQMLAVTEEYEIVDQEKVDAAAYAPRMAMQPDRMAIRNVHVEHYVDIDRHVLFALEKDGLTTIAQIVYSEGFETSEEAQQALTYVVLKLQMDSVAIHAELDNPIAPTIEAARGVPPTADQVIYAETPVPIHNTLTLNVTYEDDARYMDKAVLETDGPTIDMNDNIFYYVPPQPDGTTIEGVFKSSSGYAGFAAQVGGVSVLKTETLVFAPNGRFSTSAASGMVASGDAIAGAATSQGSGSEGEGSYRINGYTLELRLDDGTVQQEIFFPYMSRTFWPGSDGPSDEFDLINLGGEIMYRDDG